MEKSDPPPKLAAIVPPSDPNPNPNPDPIPSSFHRRSRSDDMSMFMFMDPLISSSGAPPSSDDLPSDDDLFSSFIDVDSLSSHPHPPFSLPNPSAGSLSSNSVSLVGGIWIIAQAWQKLGAMPPGEAMEKYIKLKKTVFVGLMCAQREQEKRPTMSEVVEMLINQRRKYLNLKPIRSSRIHIAATKTIESSRMSFVALL